MIASTTTDPVRLGVPRHLQDCNGYCGPACVMMVQSGAAAQHELFRRVRDHAKQAGDRRPVKSPAESLLALLAAPGKKWEKVFHPEPLPVAERIIAAVTSVGQPCLLLVSKGMHWVVAFGRTLHDDGTVAGVLLRDPAWAGMPKFFGLTTLPEKPTFQHSAHDPCTCLASDNPPGSVHERYLSMDELLSPRGLQGSPDWEGKGALALVPAEALKIGPIGHVGPIGHIGPISPTPDPRAAALEEARAHGLLSRPDWQALLDGGEAGSPILVKDPDDSRDDFLLVPVHSKNPALRRTAWIMLDPVTFRLREASLLENWMVPAFPTDQDANNIAEHDITLPDGKRHRYKKSELRANQRNLVWAASAATILPCGPLREFIAPHPETGEPVSIYATQHGEIYTTLGPDDLPATRPPTATPAQPKPEPAGAPKKPFPWKTIFTTGAAAAGIALAAQHFLPDKKPAVAPPPSSLQVADITPTSAVASWDTVPEAIAYRLEYKEQSAGAWTMASSTQATRPVILMASMIPVFAQATPTKGQAASRRELTGLSEGTHYAVRVSSVSAAGTSAASPTTVFQTPHTKLPPPSDMLAAEITTETARISWKPVPRAVSYTLAYRVMAADNWKVADDEITGTPYILQSLKEGTKYEARAFSNGPGGPSGPSVAVAFETIAGILPAPHPLTADPSMDSALISWPAVPTAQSYKIEFKEASSDKWNVAGAQIIDTHCILPRLQPATVYFARGYSHAAAGTSTFSPEVKFKTIDAPRDRIKAPNPLTEVPESISTTGATIAWKSVAYAHPMNWNISSLPPPHGSQPARSSLRLGMRSRN